MTAELSPVEDVQADAANGDAESFVVALGTDAGVVDITVPAPGRWKSKALRALSNNDAETWAELVLDEAEYERWSDADPTLDDVAAFFVEFRRVAGVEPGKSRGSKPSSTSTPRR